MNVLFVAPESQAYYREFVRGLKELGARVIGVGSKPPQALSPLLRPLLDEYIPLPNLYDPEMLLAAARKAGRRGPLDHVETADETLVVPTAQLREKVDCPGISEKTAVLCRDKAMMKDYLREKGVPVAASRACGSDAEVRSFVEEVGLPIILKPRAGFGSLNTHKVGTKAELEALLPNLRLGDGRSMAAEEFIEGHEGFYDTIALDDTVGHEFISHYYPGCLEAVENRSVAPKVAVTNRLDSPGYEELMKVGRQVNEVLGLKRCATHMEWFFGPKGLKFSEIGARPAGERIWDMYRVANEFDVYREWAQAVLHGKTDQKPTRRFAAGSVQVRPTCDGKYVGHRGLREMQKRYGQWIYEQEIPPAGTPTAPLEKGFLTNTWFRAHHPDYDTLRKILDDLGETVKADAVPA